MAIQVRKRDGSLVPFVYQKIIDAATKAIESVGHTMTTHTKAVFDNYFSYVNYLEDGDILDVENIQDDVESLLMETENYRAAKAFILYRDQHRRLRSVVSVKDSIEEYIGHSDWRIKANSNQGYSLGGMILNISGKITANYWLNEVYTPEIGEKHRDGSYHIHDLDMLSGYCCGHSLRILLEEGFNGISGKVSSKPPKHFSTACGQIVNFLGCLQNEWAGAQAFSSFDTYMAPFVRLDNLTEEELEDELESMIYSLNVGSRWGSQCPFTNLTFDWNCPEDLKDKHPIIGGVELKETYGDFQKEMDMINKAFMKVMYKGDKDGRAFTFPIPTYNITDSFDWDHSNCEYLFKMTSKYGNPYFANYCNSDLKPTDIRSMCCRLRLDLRELLKRGNGLFGSAEQTGSIGVVTINMARLGYKHKGDWDGLYKELDALLALAKDSLERKRTFITKMMQEGLYPYTKRYLGTFRNFFSTIGVNGMNEMIRNFYNDESDITDELIGYQDCLKVLEHIRSKMTEFQQETGHLYNLEATPAEGTTYRFAKEDLKRYPDIIQAGDKDHPYYTNSSQLPVGFTSDPFEALDRQEELQSMYTGGTVLHLYMEDAISSWKACRDLVRKAVTNFKVPYISITPTFSICPKHGYISGKHDFCPKCDEELKLKYKEEFKTE